MSGSPLLVQAIAWLVLLGGLAGAVVCGRRFRREQHRLRTLAAELAPHGIEDAADLVRIKRFLSTHIRYDVAKRDQRRPLLRASAAEILDRGEGFCGENARVAIRLLGTAGVRANRLYLSGPHWDHVLVEHEWQGGWKLFDGHGDPGIMLADDEVARIDSAEIARLPNAYRDRNPWTRCYRIKLLHRWKALRRASEWRPPRVAVLLAESPDLVRGATSLMIVAVAATVLWWMG